MSLLYYLPLALATVLLIHSSDAFSILHPTTSMAVMNGAANTLATIGAATSLFGSVSLGKLVLALKHKSNFDTAFLSPAPRDAFANKVVWITGASSGIGRALAMYLSSNHDDVKLILSSRRQDVLEEVAAECMKLGSTCTAKVLTIDLSDHASIQSKAKEALGLYGGRGIDILVNNGGVSTRSMARNASFDVDTFVTDVDFLSYVALTKALIPSWEHQLQDTTKNNSKPMIINTSSIVGKFGGPVRTAYSGAKHAIQGWFDAFRIEQVMAGYPIDVLNVVLGPTRTDIARNAVTDTKDAKFGDSDDLNAAGLDTSFVVERVMAAAYAGRKEIWLAPRNELFLLYLNQYLPEVAYNRMMKGTKEYAVQK